MTTEVPEQLQMYYRDCFTLKPSTTLTSGYLRRLPKLLMIYPAILQDRAFNHRENWADNYNAMALTSYILSANCSNPQRNPLFRTCFCFSPVASTFLMFLKKWQDTYPLWSQWEILSIRECGRRKFRLLDLHISLSFSSKDKSILWGKLKFRKNYCHANCLCFISGRLVFILWVIIWEKPVDWSSVEQVAKIQTRKVTA